MCVSDMSKAGVMMDIAGIVVICLLAVVFWDDPVHFDVDTDRIRQSF